MKTVYWRSNNQWHKKRFLFKRAAVKFAQKLDFVITDKGEIFMTVPKGVLFFV